MKMMINKVRVAFVEIFEAKPFGGEGDPYFSLSALIPPGHPALATLTEAEEIVAKDKWGAKADDILKKLRAEDRNLIHDGDSKEYDGYAGNKYVSARNKMRPLVIDRDRTTLVAADGRPYSGCCCNVQVEVWAQDNKFGKRINATLKAVQFVEDGDAFSGGAPADPDEFEDLSVESENALA